MEGGVDVCLSCFNGGCPSEERHHSRNHQQRSGHPFTLNIRRRPKPTIKRDDGAEPPAKRLAIQEEREEDKYNHSAELKCWLCDPQNGSIVSGALDNGKGAELKNAIMTSLSSARQSEVKSWEEDIEACEHTLTLHQPDSHPIPAEGLAQCSKCDLKENLWLCLACGNLGCGRAQFGGVSGNGHALLHYNESGHAPAVKLGTITPEGTADVYCYKCDDSKMDLELAAHLATFGINVATQQKTEKTMTELQIDQNFNYEFSVTDENGKPFEPLFGPGLTGLQNLGNSCYMASVLQSLFALDPFKAAYRGDHVNTCGEPLPASCILCQLHKMHDGLLSGRYSIPRANLPQDEPPKSNEPVFQNGLRPSMFKALIGKGHPEFATMRQQDAEEFMTYLFKVIRTDAKKRGIPEKNTPPESFKFGMEQRLQCQRCQKVRYKVDSHDSVSLAIPANKVTKIPSDENEEPKEDWEPVELESCLRIFTGGDGLEYKCPSCKETVTASKQTRFATFPDILAVHAKKFQLVNWVPTKLPIPLLVNDFLILDEYVGKGLQQGEQELPNDGETGATSTEPEVDAEALAQLEGLGFPTTRCKRALLANQMNAEAAVQWIFEHMDDPDIDAPLAPAASQAAPADPGMISMLQDMGFTSAQASKALRETGGDMERAVEWLFSHPDDMGDVEAPGESAPTQESVTKDYGGSGTLPARYRLKAFVSHKGPSVHSGHYVAHIRLDLPDGEKWVLFNDEKVVKADEESVDALKPLAYLYIFESHDPPRVAQRCHTEHSCRKVQQTRLNRCRLCRL